MNPIVNDQKVLRTLGSGLKLKEKQKSNYTLSSRLVITHLKETHDRVGNFGKQTASTPDRPKTPFSQRKNNSYIAKEWALVLDILKSSRNLNC